jgi:ATP-dependent Clp protease protease subunit
VKYFASIAEQQRQSAVAAHVSAHALAPVDAAWSWNWLETADEIIAQLGWAGLADACAFVDLDYPTDKTEGFPTNKAAYKLPFKTLVDGKLVAVFEAVKAATQAIRDGKADLNADQSEQAHALLAAYWLAFGKQPPASPKQIQAGMKSQASPQRPRKDEGDLPETIVIQQAPQEPRGLPRTIWIRDFGFWAARDFVEDLNRMEREDPNQPVLVLIDSYGGYVHDLLVMVAAMKTSKLEIRTCAVGVAMSCGAILLSCGTKGKRYAMPYSTVMIHEVSSIAFGSMADLENEVEETKRLNEILFTILAENCGLSLAELMETLRGDNGRREHYFSPEDAVAFGIVDEVVTDFSAILPMVAASAETTPTAGGQQ